MPPSASAFDPFAVSAPPLRRADIEFTSRCNLRCTYCTVSLPGDAPRDLDPRRDARFIDELATLGVTHVTLNGRGETTHLDGWVERLAPFVTRFETRLISNFARPFGPGELDLLARVGRIDVSLDSLDRKVMREIRRKANPDTIVANIVRVRGAAARLALPSPVFTIGAGLYAENVAGLPDLARLAVSLGIAEVNFWNLVKHEDVTDGVNVRQVTDLPLPRQREALAAIDETVRILRGAGIPVHFSGRFVDALRAALGPAQATPWT